MYTDSEEILSFEDRQPAKAAVEKRPCPDPEYCVADRDRPWACRLCGQLIHHPFDY